MFRHFNVCQVESDPSDPCTIFSNEHKNACWPYIYFSLFLYILPFFFPPLPISWSLTFIIHWRVCHPLMTCALLMQCTCVWHAGLLHNDGLDSVTVHAGVILHALMSLDVKRQQRPASWGWLLSSRAPLSSGTWFWLYFTIRFVWQRRKGQITVNDWQTGLNILSLLLMKLLRNPIFKPVWLNTEHHWLKAVVMSYKMWLICLRLWTLLTRVWNRPVYNKRFVKSTSWEKSIAYYWNSNCLMDTKLGQHI